MANFGERVEKIIGIIEDGLLTSQGSLENESTNIVDIDATVDEMFERMGPMSTTQIKQGKKSVRQAMRFDEVSRRLNHANLGVDDKELLRHQYSDITLDEHMERLGLLCGGLAIGAAVSGAAVFYAGYKMAKSLRK